MPLFGSLLGGQTATPEVALSWHWAVGLGIIYMLICTMYAYVCIIMSLPLAYSFLVPQQKIMYQNLGSSKL